MTYYDLTVIVTIGMAVFYAIDLIEKGRNWLRDAQAAEGNRWARILKEGVVWLLLIWLGGCVFSHLVLASLHRGT